MQRKKKSSRGEIGQYFRVQHSCNNPEGVSSREGNEHVPVWNHDITLIPLDGNHTKYTDRVEIRAGWKTPFIWLWANAFYAHRQRKWIHLLKNAAEAVPCERDREEEK